MSVLSILVVLLLNRIQGITIQTTEPPVLPNEAVDQLMNMKEYQQLTFEDRWILATRLVNDLIVPGLTPAQADFVRDKISAALIGLDYAPE